MSKDKNENLKYVGGPLNFLYNRILHFDVNNCNIYKMLVVKRLP